jgi:uncharacterized membrane protein YedE/YeeE
MSSQTAASPAPSRSKASGVLRTLAALAAGLLFGAGLTVSQMIDPAKVVGFLDLFGQWDPSLALVMAGGLAVTFLGYRLAHSLGRPWLAPKFQMPSKRDLDAPLLLGSVLFGIGWGLAGYCPGPAIAALALGEMPTVVFVIAMLAGMLIYRMAFEARG